MIFSDTTFLILLCLIICINFFFIKMKNIYSIILFSFLILYTNHPKSFLAALILISFSPAKTKSNLDNWSDSINLNSFETTN